MADLWNPGPMVPQADYDALKARIAQLEAALRDLIDYTDITKHVDADAVTERVKRARVVLGLTSETACEHLSLEKPGDMCSDCGFIKPKIESPTLFPLCLCAAFECHGEESANAHGARCRNNQAKSNEWNALEREKYK